VRYPVVTLWCYSKQQNRFLAHCQLTIHFNRGHRRDATHKVGSSAFVWSSILPLNIGNRKGVVAWDLHSKKNVPYFLNCYHLTIKKSYLLAYCHCHISVCSLTFHGDSMHLGFLRVSVMVTQNKTPVQKLSMSPSSGTYVTCDTMTQNMPIHTDAHMDIHACHHHISPWSQWKEVSKYHYFVLHQHVTQT
jgi:hypothetical protein